MDENLSSQPIAYVYYHTAMYHVKLTTCVASTVWVKKSPPPPAACGFLTFFHKRLRILNQFYFLHTSYTFLSTLDYKFLFSLSPTLTKLCHIKHDYLVHIICSKCPLSAEMLAFRRLRQSLIALLLIVCGKSSQICCFYSVNKYAGYDMTSTVTSFAPKTNLEVKF